MKTDDRLLLKFKLLIKELEKRLSYKLETKPNADINEADYSDVSPLRIIFPDYVDRPYIKTLVSKVYTVFPHNGIDMWAARCEGNNSFRDMNKRMELAGMYMQMHSFRRGHFTCFIFWSMVGIIADKEDFSDKLSLIIDFARIFGMSEDELLDIAEVAKAFYGENEEEYEFKTKEVETLFSGVYNHLSQ